VTVVYECAPGLRLEAVGDVLVAFSALSGETLLLNDEAAAILDVVSRRPSEAKSVCEELARETGVPEGVILQRTRDSWAQLIQAGLLRDSPGPIST
jgi:PqqD family protein of HPr-rel-A system